jgi:hypothetical protein
MLASKHLQPEKSTMSKLASKEDSGGRLGSREDRSHSTSCYCYRQDAEPNEMTNE